MEKKPVILLMLLLSLTGVVVGVFAFLQERKAPRPDNDLIWHVEIGPAGTETLVRGGKIDSIRDDANKLVAALNGTDKDPELFRAPAGREPSDPPKVKLMNIKNDAASVEVINADYLTEKMGSSGAQAYLASVTFTLTEDPKIKKVNFFFEEGDHAMPGTYTRKDFANYKILAPGGSGR